MARLKRTTHNGKPAYQVGQGRPATYTPGDKSSRNAAKKRAKQYGKRKPRK